MRSSSDMAASNMPGAASGDAVRPPDAAHPPRFRPLFLLPLAAFFGLVVAFAIGLGRDPKLVPSPLIGKPVPVFSLPAVEGRSLGLSSSRLHSELSLVNVFPSWRAACREQHPVSVP